MGGLVVRRRAALPLFCQVTGYGGTTQRAEKALRARSSTACSRVRFDANVAPGMPWKFEPRAAHDRRQGRREHAGLLQGDQHLRQAGDGDGGVQRGARRSAGIYFNKIECFCFTEQTLEPRADRRHAGVVLHRSQIVDDRGRRRTCTRLRCPTRSIRSATEAAGRPWRKSTGSGRMSDDSWTRPKLRLSTRSEPATPWRRRKG